MSDLLALISVLQSEKSTLAAGPKSRERSLVITKLDEAILWAREASSLEALANPEPARPASPLGPTDSGRYA